MDTAASPNNSDPRDERTKPAFLRRVRICGYKSIAFCDVELQPLTILVGRNGSGKSNFLDALAFLRDVVRANVPTALEAHGPWSSLICRSAPTKTIEFEIEAGFVCGRPYRVISSPESPAGPQSSEWEILNLENRALRATYRLALSGVRKAAPLIYEALRITDESGELDINYKREDGGRLTLWHGGPNSPFDARKMSKPLPVPRPDSTLLGSLGVQPFIDLAEGIRWMGFYNFHPKGMRRLQTPLPGRLLGEDGGNLASVVETTNEVAIDAVQSMQDYLSVITPEIQSFSPVRYGDYETVRFTLRPPSPSTALEFDAANMSDGTLRVLGALVAAFQIVLPYGHPSVIGIEEPETSLHPAAAHALVSALDAATEHTQVLLTTHSGDLLADPKLSPSSVLVVRQREGRTEIAPVDPASHEIIRQELYTLADLQRMGQLNLDEEYLDRKGAAKSMQEE